MERMRWDGMRGGPCVQTSASPGSDEGEAKVRLLCDVTVSKGYSRNIVKQNTISLITAQGNLHDHAPLPPDINRCRGERGTHVAMMLVGARMPCGAEETGALVSAAQTARNRNIAESGNRGIVMQM